MNPIHQQILSRVYYVNGAGRIVGSTAKAFKSRGEPTMRVIQQKWTPPVEEVRQ